MQKNSNRTKSFDNNVTMLATLAPLTFLIPISFVFSEAVYETKPIKPVRAITIAIRIKENTRWLIFCSALYKSLMMLSAN